MEAPAAYPIGCRVVHPNHGAGTVVGIQAKSIGKTSHFYLVIKTHAMELMVPVNRADALGLRHVGHLPSLRATLARCCEAPVEAQIVQDRLVRQAALERKLKSGSFAQVASAVRELYCLNATRVLSTVDHQLFDWGMDFLASELALASDLEIVHARHEIEQLLAQMLEDAKHAGM